MSFQTQIDGARFTLLSGVPDTPENRELASHLLGELLARLKTAPAVAPAATVAHVVAAYLEHCEQRSLVGLLGRPALRNYRIALAHLVAAFGPRPLSSLTTIEVQRWAARPAWSRSYQHNTLGVVMQLYRFAKLKLDPPLVRPPKESRGAASCLTDEQFAAVLADIEGRKYGGGRGDLGQLLRVLRETGARPAEACGLTVENVDWPNRVHLLTRHKTIAVIGVRPLVFTDAAMAVLTRQRVKYGVGPLFRTRVGNPWQPNVIVKRLLDVSERVGFRVIAYGERHGFVTRALVEGVPESVVAALVGHASTKMMKNYSHVGAQSKVLRDAAERVSRGRAG